MNYKDIFKKIIKEEVLKNNGDKAFIDDLYEKIKSNVILTGTILHLPNVDEITLKSYFETAKKEYLSVNPIDPGICHTLTKKGFISWLDGEREKETDWDYSERYFTHLLNSGRSAKVV